MEMLSRGRHVAPRLAFRDVSSFNGGMPNASVTRLRLLLVSTCCGSSAPATVTNCVLTLLNHTWWSEGARKPLLRAPRRAKPGTSSSRAATFPVTVLPKSRSEEHTSELQSLTNLVCRLLLEKKNTQLFDRIQTIKTSI